MGYYDGSPMALWKLAQQYVLADHFFQGAFGGSFLNHIWLACACAPTWPAPPASLMSSVDDTGTRLVVASNSPASALEGGPAFVSDNVLTPVLADGRAYAVNTAQPSYQPSGVAPAATGDPRLAAASGLPLPPQTARTIGDTLSARGIDWRWYAGAWKQALADRSVIYGATGLQPHHQPFNYFARFDPTTAAGQRERDTHLRDYTDLLDDIRNGTLPPVAFYKPQANLNQHAGYATVAQGDAHVAELIAKLQTSAQWKNLLVVVTYDEHGGWWDHVAPPQADRWGPGSRVPALLISPLAKKGYIDSVPYDSTSILQFVTRRFGLEPLPGVRRQLGDLSNSLDVMP